MELFFLGETFFQEKGFPEPLAKTFLIKNQTKKVQI